MRVSAASVAAAGPKTLGLRVVLGASLLGRCN